MKFVPYGPFELPRGDDRLLLLDRDARRDFWDNVNVTSFGLPDACGCYIFSVKSSSRPLPWYVGKAENQSFKSECFTPDKIIKFNSVLIDRERGIPQLFFLARTTVIRNNFSNITRRAHRDVRFLEEMLIGSALSRNKYLVNKQETEFLRNIEIPGLLNNRPGAPSNSALELKRIIGWRV